MNTRMAPDVRAKGNARELSHVPSAKKISAADIMSRFQFLAGVDETLSFIISVKTIQRNSWIQL